MMPAKTDWRRFLAPAAVFTTAAALYLPSLRYDFVNWDDFVLVLQNPYIRQPLELFRGGARTTALHLWSPLSLMATLSYAADLRLWGLNPLGFHLTNVLLHAADAALVFLLARSLADRLGFDDAGEGGAALAAVIAAALFAAHPQRVESVAWIADRKDLLCAFFFLASLNAYVGYASRPAGRRRALYLLSLGLFALALLSKPMAITLPFTLMILDWFPIRRLSGDDRRLAWLDKTPFFALSAAMGLLMLWNYVPGMEGNADRVVSSARLFELSVRALGLYCAKLAAPWRLAPLYLPPADAVDPAFIVSGIGALAISLLCLWAAKRGRKGFLAAWSYFVVSLLPVLAIARHADFFAADRYTLLPSIGPCILAGLLLAHDWRGGDAARRSVVSAATIGILLAFSIKTLAQERIWRDSGTLWTHQLRYDPSSALAHNNLGEFYYRSGRNRDALNEFQAALTLNPAYEHAALNAAQMAFLLGDQDALKKATSIVVGPGEHDVRALYYSRTGRRKEAVLEFAKAALANPTPETLNNLGVALNEAGRREEAVKVFQSALQFDPSSSLTHDNLGAVYKELGRDREAAAEFSAAIKAEGR